jgi:hypothetical protein
MYRDEFRYCDMFYCYDIDLLAGPRCLGLERVKVGRCDANGKILVGPDDRTSQSNIYAIGDVAGMCTMLSLVSAEAILSDASS